MLHSRLAAIDAQPLGRGESWLIPALLVAACASGAVLFWAAGEALIGGLLAIGTLLAGAVTAVAMRRPAVPDTLAVAAPDYSLVASALALSADPAAVTSSDGRLITANTAYRERFPEAPAPTEVGADEEAARSLASAQSLAWRDGHGAVTELTTVDGTTSVEVQRVGSRGDQLLWRFSRPRPDPLAVLVGRVTGSEGDIMARSGLSTLR